MTKIGRRRGVRLRAPAGLVTVAVLAMVVASAPPAASAAGVTAHWATIEVHPPLQAQFSVLDTLSCTGVGSCVAGGTYNLVAPPELGNGLAMIASESNGIWHTAREISLPADASATAQNAVVTGIACPRPRVCTAVGVYVTDKGDHQGRAFIATESHGTWGRAVGVLAPPHVGPVRYSSLAAVSCTRPGSCVALGSYVVKSAISMMSITEAAGRWSRARTVQMPANLARGSALTALSCPAAGSCVAVGSGQTASGSVRVLAAAQSRGRWRVTELRLPRNAEVLAGEQFGGLTSVSCRRPGSCVAVGRYIPRGAAMAGEPAALTVTESAGRWGSPAEMSAAPRGAVGPPDVLESVSCTRTSCMAVGSYFNGASSGWWMSVTYQRGRWGHPLKIRLPANADSVQNGAPASVDCVSATACTAVGPYTSRRGDISYTQAAAARS